MQKADKEWFTMTQLPQWLINKAQNKRNIMSQEIKQALASIDSKYHNFLVLLPQKEKIAYKEFNVNGYDNLGLSSFNNSTYVEVFKPYVTVDGRLKMLRDEHEAANKQFHVHAPQFIPLGDTLICSVTVDSEIYGSATGVIELGREAKGVDQSNPFAKAQTSAIGRALGFLGYGLIGNGVGDSQLDLYFDTTETSNQPTNNAAPVQQKQTLYKFELTAQEPPTLLENGANGLLFSRVLAPDGREVLLWFPSNMIEEGSSIFLHKSFKVVGWYDSANNCINATELVNEAA